MLEGHLNVLVRDHDSVCTGFGQHDRVVAFCPEGNEAYARIDHKWNLGDPTDKQILAVCRKEGGLKGRWKVVSREPWTNKQYQCTDVHLRKH